MTGFDYGRMQGTAGRLMERFQQGTVQLRRTTVGTPPNAWTPGAETVETWTLKASVRRVSTKYVDGALIVATDNQITFAVPPVVPSLSHEEVGGTTKTDTLVIDGREYVMKDLRPIPGAGVPVAYIAFVAS